MRISSSTIGMDSARSFTSATTRSSFLKNQSLQLRQGALSFNGSFAGSGGYSMTMGKSGAKQSMLDIRSRFASVSASSIISTKDNMEALDRIRQQCIQYLIQLFYPNRRGFGSSESVSDSGTENVSGSDASQSVSFWQAGYSETYTETESTSFQTKGSVVTADGRTIDFNLEMQMSRSFSETMDFSYQTLQRNVNLCDPLVINLDNNVAEVSDQKFLFDIDGDGILDRISELNGGSGYLALDKNGDGIINDGSELFGTQSGNGFSDLAQYDSDGNGWIDEGDEIWKKLLIWTKDENGKDRLYHISEKGIGAICLQNAATDFSLNSLYDNQTNARIRSTGIFLYENGGIGTVQHVDLAKENGQVV